ncbi:MAG: amidohydrolase [Theionarchaea archaeon]|nr:amidohydrolase [Theionarchaea archaeon]
MILLENVTFLDGSVGNVTTEGKFIESVGEEKDRSDIVIDGTGYLVIPGLVNTHTHLAMTLLRGYGDDLPLQEWLETKVWPAEKGLTGEAAYYGSLLGAMEMVKSGTTCFVDMYFFCRDVARAVEEIGMRGYLGSGIFDFPSPESENPFETAVKFIEEARGKSDLVVPVMAPHALYTCSEETFHKCLEVARKHDLIFHTHVSETEREVREFIEQKGMTPVEFLHEGGFLDERFLAAHCVWLNDEELDMFAERQVKVSHNPVSNMKIAAGVMRLPDMVKKGITVSLATDGAASNNSLDMIEVMKVCALLHKVHTGDPTAVTAGDVLRMGTVNGAESLGLKAGVVAEGYLADLVLVDVKKPNAVPYHDFTSNMVYALQSGNVDTVICNGKVIMENRRFLGVDEQMILEKAEVIAQDMVSG